MKLGLTLAAIVLLASSASAQSPLGTQAFATNSSAGKTCTVTHYDDGTWSGCGLTVTAATADAAASAFQLFTVAGDTAPLPTVPLAQQIASVPMWQVKVALANQPSISGVAGKTLLDDANSAVAAASVATQLAWSNAANVQRNSPTLAAMSAVLGLSSAQVDQLYIAASQVTE